MALKTDPTTLKAAARLWSELARIPGVELVHFEPDECCRLGSVVCSTRNVDRSAPVALEFREEEHPAAFALMTGGDEDVAIADAVEQLRGHLAGADPDDYRPLPVPEDLGAMGMLARHIRLDGFPVRVVRSWRVTKCGYLTSFDTFRPRGAELEPVRSILTGEPWPWKSRT